MMLSGYPFYSLREEELPQVAAVLNDPNITSVCLNGSPRCPDDEYRVINVRLQEMLERKFPEKSSFEVG